MVQLHLSTTILLFFKNLPLNPVGRKLNREYKEKIVFHVIRHYAKKLFLPAIVCHAVNTVKALPYLWRAVKCLWRREITVDLLDGVAIGVSLLTGDFETAGSVMFLLKPGDHLEERTHKKSVDDLAQRMALNVDSAWLRTEGGAEARAANMADRLVPWTLGASLLTGLLTGDVSRAVAVLMVDFSCALKLSMPLSVLSAMLEAGGFKITVKGGKYLEAISDAETVLLDKTGTLTNACPTVAEVVPFNGTDPDEMLRIAACLEEHFPHSMANAVVRAAKERNLAHEEMRSEVEYRCVWTPGRKLPACPEGAFSSPPSPSWAGYSRQSGLPESAFP